MHLVREDNLKILQKRNFINIPINSVAYPIFHIWKGKNWFVLLNQYDPLAYERNQFFETESMHALEAERYPVSNSIQKGYIVE